MTLPNQAYADPYARIAELYDLEHDEVHDDIELYSAIADQVEGRILEVGCGSGRLLVPLAQAGHDVTGIDRSTVMLDRARARIARASTGDRISLLEQAMESALAAPGAPFGLVLFSLNALMHLDNPANQIEALTAARAVMRQHGQIVVDILNPTPHYLVDLARAPIHEWSTSLDDGSTIDKWSVRVIDAIEQTIDTTLWYDQVSASGSMTRLRTEFVLRYVYANELVLMLERAGFADIRLFGGTELDALTEASERILAIASTN